MKLSIILGSIREKKLSTVYHSILESYHGDWEFIAVAPYELPSDLKEKTNIKFIQDWGNPTRSWQIALLHSEGEYIHYTADDATYFPNTLDKALELLQGEDDKTLVMSKYYEGKDNLPLMASDCYYHFSYHRTLNILNYSGDYWILNVGTAKKKLFEEIGGWDCRFESTAIANIDFSMRVQNYGVKIIIQRDPIMLCDWQLGLTGEHHPIHDAQTYHDLPLLKHEKQTLIRRTTIDINNWKDAEVIWKRRFCAE